jgi:hypothetical protein
MFLEARNKSTWAPKGKNLEGEVHEDIGIISYDTARKSFILRQFHVEGFVNQYILDYLAPDGKTLIFTTESIENIPAGWRTRETYRVNNTDEFTEIFELAAPEKDFELYSSSYLKRISYAPLPYHGLDQ